MGGRGTFASGDNVAYTYETVGYIEGVKVLQPKNASRSFKIPEECICQVVTSSWTKQESSGSIESTIATIFLFLKSATILKKEFQNAENRYFIIMNFHHPVLKIGGKQSQ